MSQLVCLYDWRAFRPPTRYSMYSTLLSRSTFWSNVSWLSVHKMLSLLCSKNPCKQMRKQTCRQLGSGALEPNMSQEVKVQAELMRHDTLMHERPVWTHNNGFVLSFAGYLLSGTLFFVPLCWSMYSYITGLPVLWTVSLWKEV